MPLHLFPRWHFHLAPTISGYPIPWYPLALEWKVSDPIGGPPEVYRATRDLIEQLVMKLIVELRRKNK
jgi:hypothetical protein